MSAVDPPSPAPGGMERPKDDYKLTHNVVLKERDTTFGEDLQQSVWHES